MGLINYFVVFRS